MYKILILFTHNHSLLKRSDGKLATVIEHVSIIFITPSELLINKDKLLITLFYLSDDPYL